MLVPTWFINHLFLCSSTSLPVKHLKIYHLLRGLLVLIASEEFLRETHGNEIAIALLVFLCALTFIVSLTSICFPKLFALLCVPLRSPRLYPGCRKSDEAQSFPPTFCGRRSYAQVVTSGACAIARLTGRAGFGDGARTKHFHIFTLAYLHIAPANHPAFPAIYTYF